MQHKRAVVLLLTFAAFGSASHLPGGSLSPRTARIEVERLLSGGGPQVSYSRVAKGVQPNSGGVFQSIPNLVPGQTATLTLPSVSGPTLIGGVGSITVPEGALRLTVDLQAVTSGAAVELFLRFGQDVELLNGQPVADHSARGGARSQRITVTSDSSPALRAGAYFVGIGLLTRGQRVTVRLTATVDDDVGDRAPIPCGEELTSGVTRNWSLPSQPDAQLLFGVDGLCVDVPEGSEFLRIEFVANPGGAEFGLFATANRDAFATGEFDPDHAAVGNGLTIVIGPDSDPPLENGRYFITGIAVTTNAEMSGTLTATVTAPGGVGPGDDGDDPGRGDADAPVTLSAASFAGETITRNMIVSSFGQNLAARTESTSAELTKVVGGTSVQIFDSSGREGFADVLFVSPGQVNWITPEWPASGPGEIIVRPEDGSLIRGPIMIADVSPGLFTADFSGEGPPAANGVRVAADGSSERVSLFLCGTVPLSCVPVPIDLGLEGDTFVLELFGTGFREQSAVSAEIGRQPARVLGAVAQGQFAGLDQTNIVVDRSLIGAGDVNASFTANGVQSNEVWLSIGPAPHEILSTDPREISAAQTTTNFAVTGRLLRSVTEMQFFPPDGIRVSGVSATESEVRATLTIEADAVLGTRTMSVVSGAGRSNPVALEIVPPAAPPPVITGLSPASGSPGQTISSFTITGTDLGGVTSVAFTPPEGIAALNVSATPAAVTAELTIAPDAALGDRGVSVTSPAGTSNSAMFRVVEAAEGPRISNLRGGGLTLVGNLIVWGPVLFDFMDDDGDIRSPVEAFTPEPLQGAANMLVEINDGRRTCVGYHGTGPSLNRPGELSGTIETFLPLPGASGFGRGVMSLTLFDAAGKRSNTLEGEIFVSCQ